MGCATLHPALRLTRYPRLLTRWAAHRNQRSIVGLRLPFPFVSAVHAQPRNRFNIFDANCSVGYDGPGASCGCQRSLKMCAPTHGILGCSRAPTTSTRTRGSSESISGVSLLVSIIPSRSPARYATTAYFFATWQSRTATSQRRVRRTNRTTKTPKPTPRYAAALLLYLPRYSPTSYMCSRATNFLYSCTDSEQGLKT
jgi:hypothetical protein